ncbi:MAG: hypothetical protein IE878_00900 [Epsilonproteobacteria bacterium]|nr:hypothetical protein [Campylobacterota bacterium]MBD3838931.1 hypothetical protein [Campylobacterota bacterium]
MKEVLDFVVSKKLTFRSFKPIDTKQLGSTKKVKCYFGTNLERYFIFLIHVKRKMRVLRKDTHDFIELHTQMELLNDSKIKYKYLLIEAPLCSKAKKFLEENGWVVWHKEVE